MAAESRDWGEQGSLLWSFIMVCARICHGLSPSLAFYKVFMNFTFFITVKMIFGELENCSFALLDSPLGEDS